MIKVKENLNFTKDLENAKMLTPNDKREAALDNNLSIVVISVMATIPIVIVGIAIVLIRSVAKKFNFNK